MEQILRIEHELAEIKAHQAASDEQHKTIFTRLAQQDKLLESVHSLALSVSTLTAAQEQMDDKLDGVSKDLQEIKDKPGRRWEGLADKVWLTIAGALIGALLAHFGL
ncbi:MAG: hypothetical protein IKK34_06780 [Clostridia bacterium]|nr:hypothetical protein [Clostridia bacterium]